MNEDEAIKTLNDYLRKTHSQFCKVGAVGIPNIEYFALEKLLDLYNNQKQQLAELQAINEEHRKENGELRKENEKLNAEVIENICYRVDTKVFEEMREELKQEKEKNKKLEENQNRLAFKTNQYMNDVIQNKIISKSKVEKEFEKFTSHNNCFNLGDMQMLLDNIIEEE